MFFFFQAEDGIRDLVRSRGLGDVYKRQPLLLRFADCTPIVIYDPEHHALGLAHAGWRGTVAVSYTHLTLPTSDLV